VAAYDGGFEVYFGDTRQDVDDMEMQGGDMEEQVEGGSTPSIDESLPLEQASIATSRAILRTQRQTSRIRQISRPQIVFSIK